MELSSKKDKHLEWLSEEMELNQKHEELLAKREMLLTTTSSVYEKKEKQQQELKVDFLKAKSRNDQLIQEVDTTHQGLSNKVNNSSGVALIALKESYFKEAEKERKVHQK